eukprot:SM000159S01803  [mRNA]  locus=s159:311153:314657:- [translate_table: standard]
MDVAVRAAVEAIHAAPTRAVICLSGGASQALSWLLSVPGASNTLLEATIPYSRRSMVNVLGKVPQQFTSEATAHDIAVAAYNRALKLATPGYSVAGIGCTCALASVPPKKGPHSTYSGRKVGVWADLDQATMVAALYQGERSRSEEDGISSLLVLQALSDACKVNQRIPIQLKEGEEEIQKKHTVYSAEEQLTQLLEGEIPMVSSPGTWPVDSRTDGRRIVLSGSFNPLHDGHLKLLDAACKTQVDAFPCFEISAMNADKPPLSLPVIKQRLLQFERRGLLVVITNQPLFFKKAELLPESTFVIGSDTALRLVNPKYYDSSFQKMLDTLADIKCQGCDFLVAGRLVDGNFMVLSDIDVPHEVADLFKAIPEDEFRVDISSTEIRSKVSS